jgi:hypothetical protein
MKSGRSFLIMLVVAAGLGAYIYFVESKKDPTATDVPAKEKVFTFAPGTIEEVEISNDKAEVTKLVKKGDAWSIVAPAQMDTDATEVAGVITQLESLERVKVIEENPQSAAPFGLDPPRIRVTIKNTGDATQRVLLLGNKTATGSDLYAKLANEPKVFLISSYLESNFNKKAFDLREKTALKFTRADVNAVTVVQGTTRLALAKTGSDWRLSAPTASRADGQAVEALISQVEQAKMTGITSDNATPAELKDKGLDKPQAVVTINAGSAKAELAIGKKEDDTHFYARDLSRSLIFSVDKAVLDGLTKKADDFRVKDVFAYRSFTATAIEIASGGQTYKFEKKKASDTALEKWSMTAPAAKELDAAKFDDFLSTISNLRAESFTDKPNTGGDAVTVTARFGDEKAPQTETVTLRKVGTIVHATRAGEPGAAAVSTTDFDRAMGLFKELTGTK